MALVKGIHHVSMRCTSAEDERRVRDFYVSLLGLPILREWPKGFMVDTGCGVIEFFLDGEHPMEQGVIRHFALQTDSVDDCVSALTAAGYAPFLGPKSVEIPTEPPYPIRMAFCIGPLGEEIEFFEER